MTYFDGETYVHARDSIRLSSQLGRVLKVMKSGRWITLKDLAEKTGDPEASVSARIRDLRKKRFGSHNIERQYVRKGVFRYRLVDHG